VLFAANFQQVERTGLLVSAIRIQGFALFVVLSALCSAGAATETFTLTVERKHVQIGSGLTYDARTYNGTVPGPLLCAHEGDEVTIHLINHTTEAHGINVHAAQIAPEHFLGDTMRPVNYGLRAEVLGVFIYHCNAIPLIDQASGMYGMMIVDPKGGWPNGDAQEVMVVQSEFYGLPDAHGFIVGDQGKMIEARADFIVFNGALNKLGAEHPIPIKLGRLVRMFFLNAGPNLWSALHVSGVIFKTVYRNGNPRTFFTVLTVFHYRQAQAQSSSFGLPNLAITASWTSKPWASAPGRHRDFSRDPLIRRVRNP